MRAKAFCFRMLCTAFFSSSLSWRLAGWFFRLGITHFSKSKYKIDAFRFFLYPMAGIQVISEREVVHVESLGSTYHSNSIASRRRLLEKKYTPSILSPTPPIQQITFP